MLSHVMALIARHVPDRSAFAVGGGAWLLWLAALSGCDDGIGRPIRASPSINGGDGGTAGAGSVIGSGEAGQTAGAAALSAGQSGDGGHAAVGGQGGSSGSGGISDPSGVLDPAACDTVGSWEAQDAQAEDSLLISLNSVRASGSACDTLGPSIPPLTVSPELQCAARLHVRDMLDRAYFDTITPERITPEQRIQATGHVFSSAGESLWRGTTNEVIQQVISNQGDCSNTANPQFVSAGVGHTGNYWVVDFSAP